MDEDTENKEETIEPELIKRPPGRPKGSLGKKPNRFSKRRNPEKMREFKARKDLRERRASGDLTRRPRSSGLTYSSKHTDKTEELKNAAQLVDALSTTKTAEIEARNPELNGLNDQQKMMVRLKMRGIPQKQIATILKVSQPHVSMELKKVREIMISRGKDINQDLVVGETLTLYEEIEHKAWELYSTDKEVDKLKALSLIVSARKENTKLLMDLGKLERAGSTSEVKVTVSPFLEKWKKDADPRDLAKAAITSKLPQLEAPEPPEDIEDAEIVEDE